jgi:hypothetical protein
LKNYKRTIFCACMTRPKLSDEIEVEVQGDTLIVRSIHCPRQGWDKQFLEMASRGDDKLLDSEAGNLSSWDKAEWEWKQNVAIST